MQKVARVGQFARKSRCRVLEVQMCKSSQWKHFLFTPPTSQCLIGVRFVGMCCCCCLVEPKFTQTLFLARFILGSYWNLADDGMKGKGEARPDNVCKASRCVKIVAVRSVGPI